jgi:hypothetical protein
VEVDEQNPIPPTVVAEMIRTVYAGRTDVKVILIPDIKSVNYGRGVGYEIIEHEAPPDVWMISATAIRRMIQAGNDTWRARVPLAIGDRIEEFLTSTGR